MHNTAVYHLPLELPQGKPMASHSAAVRAPARSIVIGLDFGTHGSGFAYTINGATGWLAAH